MLHHNSYPAFLKAWDHKATRMSIFIGLPPRDGLDPLGGRANTILFFFFEVEDEI